MAGDLLVGITSVITRWLRVTNYSNQPDRPIGFITLLDGMKREDIPEHSARIKFQLYLTYGLGDFNNWLSLQKDRIERKEILDALAFPSVRNTATTQIAILRHRIAEIEGLLSESEGVSI